MQNDLVVAKKDQKIRNQDFYSYAFIEKLAELGVDYERSFFLSKSNFSTTNILPTPI